jgi:hypothetical protein
MRFEAKISFAAVVRRRLSARSPVDPHMNASPKEDAVDKQEFVAMSCVRTEST